MKLAPMTSARFAPPAAARFRTGCEQKPFEWHRAANRQRWGRKQPYVLRGSWPQECPQAANRFSFLSLMQAV
jgi:hypothetical protein